MSEESPFTQETVNGKEVRQTAFLTVLLLLTGLFSMLSWIALLLCIDFFIRGFTHRPISPLRRAARAQVKILRLKPGMIDAAPGIFAAKIGFAVTAIITLLSFSGLHTAARNLTELLVLAVGLEAFAGICIGGHLYSIWQTHRKPDQSNTE